MNRINSILLSNGVVLVVGLILLIRKNTGRF